MKPYRDFSGASGISVVSDNNNSSTMAVHAPVPSASRSDFANLRARIRQQRSGGYNNQSHQSHPSGQPGRSDHLNHSNQSNDVYRPSNGSRTDPDYYEKKELLLRIETMQALGFTFPKGLDYSTPVEDLKSEISRKEVAMNTISDVDYVIGWIKTITDGIQGFNSWCGGFLPMNDYSERVAKRIKEPRFRYAIYQLLLRYKRQGSGSPWKEVILVLVLPLIECIVIKIVQYFARDRLPFDGSFIDSGVRTLFGMGTNALGSKSKVPDIDGVTVNMGPADDGIDRRNSDAKQAPKPPSARRRRSRPRDEARPSRPSRPATSSDNKPTDNKPTDPKSGPRRMPRPTDNDSDSDTGVIITSRDVE